MTSSSVHRSTAAAVSTAAPPSSPAALSIAARPFVAAVLSIAALCVLAVPASAQQPTRADPCSSPAHRAFDFWVGEWDVYNPQGALAGQNTIRVVHAGCALEERWTGASGVTGGSLNAYDPSTGTWRQSWVDSSGMVLELEGGPEGSDMVMSGRIRNADGTTSLHRITWSPMTGGAVRQHWQVSGDDGATWASLFDGTYRPDHD